VVQLSFKASFTPLSKMQTLQLNMVHRQDPYLLAQTCCTFEFFEATVRKSKKIGNVLTVGAMRTMEQAKLDASAVAVANEKAKDSELQEESGFGGSSSSSAPATAPESKTKAQKRPRPEEAPTPVKPRSRPHMSKRARKQMKGGGGSHEGGLDTGDFDVTVDGAEWDGAGAPGKSKKAKKETQQFYLSTELDLTEEAKEKGLDMEQYQMDLMPDDSSDIRKAKSVMRWDARKKKYLPTMVSVDGRALKGQRRNERGQKVKGDAEKTNIYQKWAKATKKRIQKVGEMENASSDPLGKLGKSKGKTIEFGADGAVSGFGGDDDGDSAGTGRERKPIVPFHGKIDEKHLTHKQKRMMKKRQSQDRVAESGGGKKELKTPQQIQQEANRVHKSYKLHYWPELLHPSTQ